MIEHLRELADAGICSFKIEGRMKSAYYTAVVTNAYRHALDAALQGKAPDKVWIEETEKISHRPYSSGFYFGDPGQHYGKAGYISTHDIVAVVESCDESGSALLTERNKLRRGEQLELLTPNSEPIPFTAEELFDDEGDPIEEAHRAMMRFRMKLPVRAERLSIVRRAR